MNLNSILIGSEDPKRLAEYYSKLFGEPRWDEGGYTGWQIGNGGVSVGPHSEVKGRNEAPGRIIWNIESADVRGDFERLKAAGATVVREPYTPEGAPEDQGEMLVATFAEVHGGRAWVEEREGGGASFRVLLAWEPPVADDPADEAQPTGTGSSAESQA